MSRRPLTAGEHLVLISQVVSKNSLGFYELPTGVRKKPPTPSKSKRPRAYTRAFEYRIERGREILSGVSSPDCAGDLVGLYAVLHEHVFGVLPLELKQDYGAAVSSADKLVRDEFAGDYAAAERFLAWCWKRTRHSVKRKVADGEDPFRPGWRIQFKSRTWLTDFKASLPRKLR